MQLRRTVDLVIGGIWGEEPRGASGTPVVRVADFDYERLRASEQIPTLRQVSASQLAARTLRPGDLLLEKSGGGEQQNVGRVVMWSGVGEATCSNFIALLRPSAGHEPRFLAYLHRALYLAGRAAACTKQTTGIQNLDVGAYLSTAVEIPDHDRQREVSVFLDQECARIADLIATTQRFDAVRAEAVERALSAAIDESGASAVLIRLVAKTGTGHTPSRERTELWASEDCVVPWFTLADVWQIRDDACDTVEHTTESISEAGIRNSSAVKHPAGTVLLSRTASVGFSAVMGRDMAVSQDFMTWTCGPQLDPYYLLCALRAMRPTFRQLMTGSTHKTIYMADLHALKVPLPPVDVQRSVVTGLRKGMQHATALRQATYRLRECLHEYRNALIVEAMIGDLDVTSTSPSQMEERLHAASEGRLEEVA